MSLDCNCLHCLTRLSRTFRTETANDFLRSLWVDLLIDLLKEKNARIKLIAIAHAKTLTGKSREKGTRGMRRREAENFFKSIF